jgi:chromosome segregation ATPase
MNLQQLNKKIEQMEKALKNNEQEIERLNIQNSSLKNNITSAKKLIKKYEVMEAELEKQVENLNLIDLDNKPKKKFKFVLNQENADTSTNEKGDDKKESSSEVDKYFSR